MGRDHQSMTMRRLSVVVALVLWASLSSSEGIDAEQVEGPLVGGDYHRITAQTARKIDDVLENGEHVRFEQQGATVEGALSGVQVEEGSAVTTKGKVEGKAVKSAKTSVKEAVDKAEKKQEVRMEQRRQAALPGIKEKNDKAKSRRLSEKADKEIKEKAMRKAIEVKRKAKRGAEAKGKSLAEKGDKREKRVAAQKAERAKKHLAGRKENAAKADKRCKHWIAKEASDDEKYTSCVENARGLANEAKEAKANLGKAVKDLAKASSDEKAQKRSTKVGDAKAQDDALRKARSSMAAEKKAKTHAKGKREAAKNLALKCKVLNGTWKKSKEMASKQGAKCKGE